ncbi:hypothetical protein RvY_03261, partial [Ramazzottius varieornatus]
LNMSTSWISAFTWMILGCLCFPVPISGTPYNGRTDHVTPPSTDSPLHKGGDLGQEIKETRDGSKHSAGGMLMMLELMTLLNAAGGQASAPASGSAAAAPSPVQLLSPLQYRVVYCDRVVLRCGTESLKSLCFHRVALPAEAVYRWVRSCS